MRAAPAATKSRLTFLGVFSFLWLALLFARLVDLQVIRHPELAARAQRQQQRTLEVTPKRGVISDRNGRELAVSVAVDSVFAVPGDVSDSVAAARLLAPVLKMETADLKERLRSDRSFVWLKRKLDAAEAERVRTLNLSGIYSQREYKRFYPKRELAAHVLGFVGIDENGLAGLEHSLDDVIRGRPRRVLITADGRRRPIERNNEVPYEGASVVLTLDENIQYLAEQELATAIAETRAKSGTLIVMETRTGQILALANYPTFNPNEPNAVPASRHVNPAVSLAYEPGSTFKVVTIAGALEEGLAHPSEVIDCQHGSIEIAGHRIRDHKPFGLLTLRQVIHESSDVGAIKVGLRLGNQKMYQHIRQWRFGEPTGIELPAESPGLLRPSPKWSRISIGAISMGQEVAITSLQLAAAISAIGNQGVWVQPHVVKQVVRGNQGEKTTEPHRKRIIPEGVAEELGRMLAGVVQEGTGRRALPSGYSAAGKTGTAQKIDASGAYSRTDFIASFAGYAPAEDPVVTVAVVLDTPRGRLYHGGEVAAPVFARVAERTLGYLNVPRTRAVPVEPQRIQVERTQAGQQPGAWAGFDAPRGENGISAHTVELRQSSPEPAAFAAMEIGVPEQRVIVAAGEAVTMPDFGGLTLRAVGERCARLGLDPVLVGAGVVAAQRPAPGTRVPRGSQVWVEFRSSLPVAPARPM